LVLWVQIAAHLERRRGFEVKEPGAIRPFEARRSTLPNAGSARYHNGQGGAT
jgi:hypothetical protein